MAVHYLPDTKQNICGNVVPFAELCKGSRANAGFFLSWSISLFQSLLQLIRAIGSFPTNSVNISYIIPKIHKFLHWFRKLNILWYETIKIVFCFPDRKRSGHRLLNTRWSLLRTPFIVSPILQNSSEHAKMPQCIHNGRFLFRRALRRLASSFFDRW